MFGQTFYYGSVKKYVTLFGTLFNNIYVNRFKEDRLRQTFKVPLSYMPRDKFIARVQGDPNLDREVAIVLPRMSFEMISYQYAAERKLPTNNRFITDAGVLGDRKKFQYNPVPYDIGFQLTIGAKNTEDGLHIIEQILPYFTPEFTTTVQLIDDPEIVMDIPLIINGITNEDIYEGPYDERRTIFWTIDFMMKGYIFGPTKKAEIIKLANVNFYDSTTFDNIEDAVGNSSPIARVEVYPGQLANGGATDQANLAISNTESIGVNEDWDYVTVVTDPLLEE